jgi:hypothetical protein
MSEEEMKYLHDIAFRVITLSDIGYGENSHSFHIKAIGVAHIERCGPNYAKHIGSTCPTIDIIMFKDKVMSQAMVQALLVHLASA